MLLPESAGDVTQGLGQHEHIRLSALSLSVAKNIMGIMATELKTVNVIKYSGVGILQLTGVEWKLSCLYPERWQARFTVPQLTLKTIAF